MNKISLCSFWSEDALKKRFNEIGERAFNRGFRQQAILDDETLFRHFTKCIRYDEPIPPWQHTWAGVDLSTDTRQGTIITVIGIDSQMKRYLVDIQKGAWSSPETADRIKAVNEKYKPVVIMVENNAYQQSIIDWMRTKDYGHIPISAFTTGKQKSDSLIGLPALDVEFEQGQWIFYLPKHDIGCQCTMCQFANEVKIYPCGKTDDHVMSLWFASMAYKKFGVNRSMDIKTNPTNTAGLRNKKW